jgi:transcriptional regulator with XRE-family HTH domain
MRSAAEFLEELTGGPLTLTEALISIRQGEGWSQSEMGHRLGISRAHVCDIEKGRRTLSPERAAKFARILGYSETQFVQLALQDQISQSGLKMVVSVDAA